VPSPSPQAGREQARRANPSKLKLSDDLRTFMNNLPADREKIAVGMNS
jgi:hypothetical protein